MFSCNICMQTSDTDLECTSSINFCTNVDFNETFKYHCCKINMSSEMNFPTEDTKLHYIYVLKRFQRYAVNCSLKKNHYAIIRAIFHSAFKCSFI